jgi:hypothetical protein
MTCFTAFAGEEVIIDSQGMDRFAGAAIGEITGFRQEGVH